MACHAGCLFTFFRLPLGPKHKWPWMFLSLSQSRDRSNQSGGFPVQRTLRARNAQKCSNFTKCRNLNLCWQLKLKSLTITREWLKSHFFKLLEEAKITDYRFRELFSLVWFIVLGIWRNSAWISVPYFYSTNVHNTGPIRVFTGILWTSVVDGQYANGTAHLIIVPTIIVLNSMKPLDCALTETSKYTTLWPVRPNFYCCYWQYDDIRVANERIGVIYSVFWTILISLGQLS